MNILPADGSVHVADSTFRQRVPGRIQGVNTDQLGDLFAWQHAGGELALSSHCC